MPKIHLFTVGFTKKSAESFFTAISDAGVRRLIDVRLNNTSQLAGFAKKDDLPYFLHAICGIDYLHLPELAPTPDILDAYKKHNGDWMVYERAFVDLIKARRVEANLSKELLDGACLLCSEDKPERCHRRLVAEYLQEQWGNVELTHLT